MLAFIPAEDMVELLEDAEEQWWKCSEEDWKEAFSKHPRIGEKFIKEDKNVAEAWAASEQSGVSGASEKTLLDLEKANREYEDKFGYKFIICATGLSAAEMLVQLQVRLQNNPETEIEIAADEQNKITKLRIEKLLDE
jgi:2-oxo-4-hydroxy-4-carboxy-5-ureidoimidazoline decarboxylase